jgi:uncharacterized damage-inducible protein DinB
VESEIERIADELDREHTGDPWHGSPLMEILRGVTVREAARRPIPDAHSILELVLHVTAWKNEVRRRLSGAPAGDPQEGDWPDAGDASEERWHAALAALESAHRELVAAVRSLPETALYRPTNDPRDRPTGAGVTHYVLLHGIVQHDVYHAGQIALLRKAKS